MQHVSRDRRCCGSSDDSDQMFSDLYPSSSEDESSSESSDAVSDVEQRQKDNTKTLLQVLRKSKHVDVKQLEQILKGKSAEQISEEMRKLDEKGNSAIHYAALKKQVDCIKFLLDHGADVNAAGQTGRLPLHFAVMDNAALRQKARKYTDISNNAINTLLSAKANISGKDEREMTALLLAVNLRGQKRILQNLLQHLTRNMNDEVESELSKALDVACQQSKFFKALLLLRHGAEPLHEDLSGNTPLFYMLYHRDVVRAKKFLQICKKKGHNILKILTAKNKSKQTVIHEAVKTGDLDFVKCCFQLASPSLNRNFSIDCPDIEDAPSVGTGPVVKLFKVRSSKQQTLMHTACKYGHFDVANWLNEICPSMLRDISDTGLSPMHMACVKNQASFVRAMMPLVSNFPISMDVQNKMPSLLTYPCLRGGISAVKEILDYGHMNKSFSMSTDVLEWGVARNLSDIIKVLKSTQELSSRDKSEFNDLVLKCAEEGRTECLLEFLEWHSSWGNVADEDGNTILHVASSHGHFVTVKTILQKNLVNATVKNKNDQTPLHMAADRGWSKTAFLIMEKDRSVVNETDGKKRTALHYSCRVGRLTLVESLIDDYGADVLALDSNDFNCLDFAIDNGHEPVVIKLLSKREWRQLLEHSTVDPNYQGRLTTPMRRLIKSMPVACKYVLDQCISDASASNPAGSSGSASGVITVQCSYDLLEDWFSPWMQRQPAVVTRRRSRGPQFIAMTPLSGSSEVNNFESDGKLKKDAKIFVHDRNERYENHPLRIMMESKHKDLLLHPLVSRFCESKYLKVGGLLFWLYLLQYLAFVLLLMAHQCVIPPTFTVIRNANSSTGFTWLGDNQQRWEEGGDAVALILFGKVGGWIVLLLAVANVGVLISQIVLLQTSLLNGVGVVRMVVDGLPQILAFLFVLPLGDLHYMQGVYFKRAWQWQCGAMAIFLGWINFIIHAHIIPFFGIYVLMFYVIGKTFVKFFVVFAVLLIAFASTLYALLMNQVPFTNFWLSLFKTLAMTSGEIDVGTIFYSASNDEAPDYANHIFYPDVTYLFFTVFIITMPILTINLLTALAVGDVGSIQKKATLYRRMLQLKTILDLSKRFPISFWRRGVIQKDTFTLTKTTSSLQKAYHRCTGFSDNYNYIVELLNSIEIKGSVDVETTSDMKLEDVAIRVKNINEKLKSISSTSFDTATKFERQEEERSKSREGIQDLRQKVAQLSDQMRSFHTMLDRIAEDVRKK